jgi:hypothetical protein
MMAQSVGLCAGLHIQNSFECTASQCVPRVKPKECSQLMYRQQCSLPLCIYFSMLLDDAVPDRVNITFAMITVLLLLIDPICVYQ